MALDAFEIKNNPKIVVYFKNLAEGESLSDDVHRIMNKIDQENIVNMVNTNIMNALQSKNLFSCSLLIAGG